MKKSSLFLFATTLLLSLSPSYTHASAPLTSCAKYMPGMAYLCSPNISQGAPSTPPPSCSPITMPNALWCKPSGDVYLCTSGSWKFSVTTYSWACETAKAQEATQSCTLYPGISYVCTPSIYTATNGTTCKVQANPQILECSNGLFLCNSAGWSSTGPQTWSCNETK